MKKLFSSRLIAFVAMLCLPFLSLTAFALSAPTGVSVGSLTPTTGTLQWEVEYASVHDYDIIVSTQQLSSSLLGNATTPCTVTAETPGVVVFVSKAALADATTYALTGLAEGTHYFVYIRQNGESQYSDNSAWVSYEFSTPCTATSVLPVLADFDGGNYLPSCWSSGAKAPTFSSSVKHGDSGNSMMLSATAADGCFVYSPVLAADAHAYYLSGYVYGVAGATYRVGVAAASDLLSVEPIFEANITVANNWHHFDVILPAELRAELEQGIEYVWVIYNPAADDAKSFYIDDVTIEELPTCVAPLALTVSSLTDTSVTLAWNERGTATSWVVEYTTGSETLTATASSNPFTLTGLTPNTDYTVRVKSVCSATDESAWTSVVALKTNCGALDIPYSEVFDNYSLGVATNATRPTEPTYPDCWNVLNESGSSSAYPQAFISSNPSYNVTGSSFFVKMSKTTPLVAIIPALSASAATDLMIQFSYRNEGASASNGHVQLGYVTNPLDASSFTLIREYEQVTRMTAIEEIAALPAGARFAFRFVGGSSDNYYASVDNVVVKVAPTCFRPKNLHVDSVATDLAVLAWVAGGSETSWELQYKLGQGDLQTVVVNNTPEYTISGLESSTSYTLSQLSLRAICSATDSSEAITFGNLNFKTECGLLTIPYTQDFEKSLFPGDCWTASYHLEGTAGGWSRTTTASDVHAGSGAAKLADAAAINRNVMATPFFHSDAANSLRVSFWMKRVSSSKPIEGVRVWVNTIATDTLGGTPLIHVTRSYTIGGTGIMAAPEASDGWYQYTAVIPAVGDVCLLFEGISEYGNYSLIDDVVIEPVPSCDRPNGVTVSALSANEVSVEISDRDSLHTAWEVVIGAVGFNPDEATPIAVSSRNATVTAPFTFVGQTTYEAYVRAVCAADDKSLWRGPSSFVYTDWSTFAQGISFTSPGQYPWTLTQEVGEYTAASGNQHIVSSVSDLVATVVVPENTKTTVSFDWASSSYSTYEGFVIYIDEANPNNTNYNQDFGKKAGTYNNYNVSGTYSVVFTTPGTHTIRFRHLYSGTYASTTYGDSQTKISSVTRRDVSCVEPSVFTMGTVTSNSAVLSWNNTGADRWEAAVFTTAQTTVALSNAVATETATGEPTVTFSGLTPNTQYYAYVRSFCGTDPSDWSEVVMFRTECAARTIPFAEGFEESGAELCWKTVGNAVTLSASPVAFDGAKSLMVYNDSVAGLLVSPRLDAASLAAYEVNLAIKLDNVRYHGALKPLTIGVMTDPSDVSTYIDLGDIVIPSAGSWKEYRFSLADLATPDYADWAAAQYVVVSMSDSATYYFDAFSVAAAASCPKPTALDVQPVGENVVVTWVSDAAAHYAEIALGDSVVFAGTVASPYTPAGLDANTLYKVRVRATCDAENSEWTPWLSFQTPCAYAAVPFAEGFEDYTATTFPDCWNQKQIVKSTSSGTDYADKCFVVNTSTGASYIHSGSKSLKLQDTRNGTHTLLTLPMFNNPRDGGLTLSFWMYRTTGTSKMDEGVKVWVNSVPSLEGATPLMHVTRCGGVAADSLKVEPITTSGWYQYEKVLPISGPTYVMLEGISEYGSASYLDDIEVKATPSCIKPSGLRLASYDAEQATITWNAGASETSWQLVYKLGTGVADTVVVNEPSFTVSSLAPSTSYTLNVLALRAVCSSDDSSDPLSATFTFKTPCATESLPISENFADGIDACWVRYSGPLFADGVSTEGATATASGWSKANKVFTDGEAKLNIYGTSCNYWLVTPSFRVTDAQAKLAFDIALTKYNATTPVDSIGAQADDKFIVAISTDGNTWRMANATVWSNAAGAAHVFDSISNTGDHYEFPLGAFVGQTLRVAFYGESTVAGGDNDFHLSNIVISEPVACDRPTAVAAQNVTSSSATIVITDPEGAAWEYTINNQEATPVATASNTIQLTDLSAQTNYTVFVRRVCGAGVASAWRNVSFTTACGNVELPYTQDFESTDFPGDCWTASYRLAGTAGSWARSTSYYHSGSAAAYLADAQVGNRNVIATPFFHSDAPNSLRVSFWMRRTSYSSIKEDEGVRVWVNTTPTDTLGGTPILHVLREYSVGGTGIKVPAEAAAGWYQYYATIPAAGDVCLIFEGISQYGSGSYIDDVVIEPVPSCERPQALKAINSTSNSAGVVITDVEDANAWEYVLNDLTAAPVAVANDTFLVSGLEANTDYTIYVRRVCSATDKSEWNSVSFKTLCEALNLPYAENFDSYSDGTATSTSRPTSGDPVYPDCWTILNESGSSSTYPQAFLTTNTGYNVSGKSFFVKSSSTTPLVAVLPALNAPASAPVTVSFSYRNESTTESNGHLQLGYVTSASDASSFVQVAEYARVTTMTAIEANMVLPANALVAFRFTNGTGNNYYVSIDNVAVEVASSCERPQSIAVVASTANSVDVMITDTVSAHSNWEVVVVAKDADPATGTPVAVSSKAATIAGTFASGVPYDVYVRTVCDEDEKSNFRGPVTFKYIDYSTFVPAGITASCPTEYVWDLVTEAGIIKSQSTNAGVTYTPCDMLLTINVPEGAETTLSYNYSVSNSTTESYGALYVYDNVAEPTTGNSVKKYTGAGSTAGYLNAGQDNLKLYAGTHVIRFRYYKTSSYVYGDDCAKVWNIAVSTSTFFVPGNLGVQNLSATQAKLTWVSSLDAVRNEVRLRSNDIDTVYTTTEDFLSLTDLTASTAYQFRVRSFSAAGDSTAWSAAYLFSTPCDAVQLPIYENFDDVTAIPECWGNQHVAGTYTTLWSVSTTGAYSGNAAYLNYQPSGNKVLLSTPQFAVEAGKAYRMSFYMKHSSTSDATSTYWNENVLVKAGEQVLDTIWNSYVREGLTSSSTPVKHNLQWTAEEDGFVSVSFTQEWFSGYAVALDEIFIEEVPDCEAPASFSIVGLSDTLVTVSINDLFEDHHAWQVALCTPDVAADSSAAQLASADTAVISIVPATPLVSGNSYVLYARANCGEGSYSPWISQTFQYVDYSALSEDLSFMSSSDYPWEIITEGALTKAQSTNDTVSNSYSDLVTNIVVPAGEKATLSFDFTVNAFPNMNYFVMYVDEANPTASNYDPEFGQQKSTYSVVSNNIGDDEEYSYTFTPTSGHWTLNFNEGTHTIRWRYYNNFADDTQSYDDYYYDDYYDIIHYTVTENYDYGSFGRHAQVYNVRYESTNHWAPEGFVLNNATASTATVSWMQCQDAVKNEVKLGNQSLETPADSIVLEGLMANTEYTIQVRSITATDTTAWSAPFAFRTDCSTEALPYATGFEPRDGGLACWTIRQTQAGTGTSGNEYGDESWQLSTRTDSTTNSTYVHSGLAAAQLRDMKAGVHSILVSPELIIPENDQAMLSFWMYRTTGSYKLEEGVKVWANDADDLTGATALMHVTRCGGVAADELKVAPITSSGWYHYEVLLPAGANRVIFEGISEWGAASYIDDIRISRVAKADTIFDITCSGSDYEGFGFSLTANELTPGNNVFSRTQNAISDLEADTVFTLKLFVSEPSLQEFRDTICAHEHYTGYGFDIADVDPLRVAPYVRHLVNQYGCDSTVSLTLFVPETEFAETVHRCEGDSYIFGDTTLTTTGTYVRSFTNQYGCDSTITLQIFFHGVASSLEASICPGETFEFGGQQLADAGTYTHTFTNAGGCDSVVTLTLNVIQPVVTNLNGVFCEGTTFAGGSISPKFMDLSVAGVYTDTLKSVLTGCDSILVLTLVEEKTQHTTVNGTYSAGKPFVYDGQSYQEAGTFEIIKTTVNGCDSIITLIITKDESALENLTIGALAVSPNPVLVGEEAVIRTELVFSADYVLRVYDAVGRLVAETTDQNGRVPAMPVAGVYTVRVSADDHHYQARLIVK